MKIGLVLEGGANRGVFTSGVLDYFMEQGMYLPTSSVFRRGPAMQ